MSIEIPSSASIAVDDVTIPDALDDVFPELVADASRCCQQCYHRLRSRRRFPHEAGVELGGILSFVAYDLPEAEPQWNTVDREYYETAIVGGRTEQAHPPGECNESRQACKMCGAVEPHRSPSTRSRSEALQAAVGISRTLQELAVAHNPLALLVEVGDLKQDPDYAGDDFATFQTATARAIRAGRSR